MVCKCVFFFFLFFFDYIGFVEWKPTSNESRQWLLQKHVAIAKHQINRFCRVCIFLILSWPLGNFVHNSSYFYLERIIEEEIFFHSIAMYKSNFTFVCLCVYLLAIRLKWAQQDCLMRSYFIIFSTQISFKVNCS